MIRTNESPSFKATRVLTATQKIKGQAPNIVDVFSLNKNNQNDVFFAKICLNEINNRKNCSTNTLQIKRLFQKFLNNEFPLSDKNKRFFIEIKNGEKITGGYITDSFNSRMTILDAATQNYQDNLTVNARKYNYYKDCLNSSCDILDFDSLEYKHLNKDDIANKLESLTFSTQQNSKYEKIENSKQDIDLFKFMGINLWK